MLVGDSDWQRRLEADGNPDRSWEETLKFYRRQNPKDGRTLAEAAQTAKIRVRPALSVADSDGFLRGRGLLDPAPRDVNDFVNAHNAAGRKMREGKK